MKNNDKKREFEVGDKIVFNTDGINFYEFTYDVEDIEFLKESVYGIVVKFDQRNPEHVIVDCINHKGMITRHYWYVRKIHIDLYQDVPRET